MGVSIDLGNIGRLFLKNVIKERKGRRKEKREGGRRKKEKDASIGSPRKQ